VHDRPATPPSRMTRQNARYLVAVVALTLISGCSGPPTSSGTTVARSATSPSVSSIPPPQARSRPTYATPGYVLGVAPISNSMPICPFEVATWDKSLLGNWTTVGVSARGPIELLTTATFPNGTTTTQRTSVSVHDSETMVDLRDVEPGAAAHIVVTAGDGPQGKGGTCEVWRVNRDTPAGTAGDVCKRKPGPLAIPKDVLGLRFSEVGSSDRELSCFNVASAISIEDGHDVNNDPALQSVNWIIVGVSPAPGTIVNADTPVNLQVKPTP
jgi:hypothetical protein